MTSDGGAARDQPCGVRVPQVRYGLVDREDGAMRSTPLIDLSQGLTRQAAPPASTPPSSPASASTPTRPSASSRRR